MENSCIIGYGTVGKVTAVAFGIKKYYSRSESTITLEEAKKCKYIFICLPTPTVNGKQDLSSLYNVLNDIQNNESIFIIRSTVLPGTNKLLQETYGIKNIVSNPEFLSEDTAEEDAKNPALIVIGADEPKYAQIVKGLYEGRFKSRCPIYVTDSVTAETIKYALNTFFTTKVVFANELYDFAQDCKANYETIREVLEKHPWGSKNHFRVWYKDRRGVHGKCLPKDTEAFAQQTGSPFFKMLMERNKQYVK